jgi:hypothetical protein
MSMQLEPKICDSRAHATSIAKWHIRYNHIMTVYLERSRCGSKWASSTSMPLMHVRRSIKLSNQSRQPSDTVVDVKQEVWHVGR